MLLLVASLKPCNKLQGKPAPICSILALRKRDIATNVAGFVTQTTANKFADAARKNSCEVC
jgi:hypothetical protein